MDISYFFEPEISGSFFILSEETSKHCIQVLRMKQDDLLHLTDGKGNLFKAVITNADKKHCAVKITAAQTSDKKYPQITIAISVLKNASRFEWFAEKATEIGVHEIIPMICERTEKQNFRISRIQNIIISAMLQSKQTWLPVLHEPGKFTDVINETTNAAKFIAHCIEEEKLSLANAAYNNEALILIGPEGDFTNSEISEALSKNFIAVELGNTRLRSETAGVVAATLLCNYHP